MSSVLARIQRGLQVVTFYRGNTRKFRNHGEAVDFLRNLTGDPATISAMRRVLMEVYPAASLSTFSTVQVVSVLAKHLVDGSLILGVTGGPMRGPMADHLGNAIVPGEPAPPEAPKPPKTPGVDALQKMLPEALEELLELLESFEIEAVDVRIEVEEALAVLKMVQVRIDLGQASLAEIPASIDRVITSMNEVANQTLRIIDEL